MVNSSDVAGPEVREFVCVLRQNTYASLHPGV